MTVNNSDNGIESALINEIRDIRRELNELRTTPQPIGNGSINYAVFAGGYIGSLPVIPAGTSGAFTITFIPDGSPFYYNNKEAIKRRTLLDFLFSVRIDTDDAAHNYPGGSALTAGQIKMTISNWHDYFGSSVSETSGQRYIIIQVTNLDSVAHGYHFYATSLIPRPALKPQ